MPTSTTPAAPLYISTVDISPHLLSPTSSESQKLIEAVKTACTTTGFFLITGHGVPRELQKRVFAGSTEFFNLPIDDKIKLDRSKSLGASNRGYEMIGGQILEEGMEPDLKEGFYIGQDIPATDPRVQEKTFFMGPNLWPEPSLVSEEVFRKPMEEYFIAMFSLSLKVLDIIAAGMPYGPRVFDEFISNDPVTAIRLLHYPPDTSNDALQLGAGAHTDFGAITILMADSPGLQVWDYQGERWADIATVEDAFVINVGDMLQMWTNGRYKSSLHRVINKGEKDRYSVPFFFDGNVNCVLKPLDGSAGKSLTVEEHMRERFATTYGSGKEK